MMTFPTTRILLPIEALDGWAYWPGGECFAKD
jgi:hypothetical protein